ncbi:LexA family protein [Eoetvoesiella caeni]|uniref:DNA polymerase V n=1 Tax=Eoetvoesiella caeni TaxID=645616 RepID=A0A366H0Z0_9BURK|nr:translesion error-prone DNA polymerase V autoproteolytic subunit [Eoetvoesiella caeni]MCI2811285.1 translesion error-prone DNA polymerase V autoproteolytic subunit [Eoetvoesiella caeni]NYT57239.1 translesion error-prone DNA polymerase V autoproteolytic subunit [Eoetvoesiella caeni]RBP33612.1 DNA polymerase V [Eoetvoesiella caeni]
MDTPVPLSQAPLHVWASPATIQCGFPSPAEDHRQKRLDLNDFLIHQADATFFMRVRGSSMRDADIDDGDYVIVDRSIQAQHGHIIVAVVDGEFTIKRLFRKRGCVRLLAANPTFPNIEFKEGQELIVWGVVTWAFKNITPVA